MILSNKTHIGIQILLGLNTDETKRLGDIADKLGVSQSYLEAIVSKLMKSGLLEARRGPSGGYLLTKSHASIAVSEVIACIGAKTKGVTAAMEKINEEVKGVESVLMGALAGLTLADIQRGNVAQQDSEAA